MKSHIAKLGLFDKNGREHSIRLEEGVNIITGRSSTGKSSLIEIFDYCFASSEYTIPDGVITENASIYFTIISIKDAFLVLARDPERHTRAFFRYDLKFSSNLEINISYFEDDYFLRLGDFKSILGNFLGIDIVDTDEDLELKKQRNKSKGRPSIRNMTSYFLQHQNLIANKHSLFYRFDEKEKREQTIDQFKIFCGFVDQEYYIKKQQLNELFIELEKIKKQNNILDESKSHLSEKLQEYLEEYKIIVGKPLFNTFDLQIISNPKEYLDIIENYEIEADYESNEFIKRLNQLNFKKNEELANRREKIFRLNQINSTIEYARKYENTIDNIKPLEDVRMTNSECPFCHHKNGDLKNESNKLSEAINWLNTELLKTPLLIDSLKPEKRNITKEIEFIDSEISFLNRQIKEIHKINEELKRNKSLEEQGLKIILQIENILEEVIQINNKFLDQKVNNLEFKINSLELELKSKYNFKQKLEKAQKYINKHMNRLGSNLDFEKTYKPINLNFNIETFELYHQRKDKKKVYLRSMGSGANWLYSHICLFTSLLRYFCSLQNKCKIPSILFLDQPSQVYFPTILDTSTTEFNPEILKKLENKTEMIDEDLKAVTNLFDQLVDLCNSIQEESGFKPQIIITDHADNLHLKNGDFEELVNGRRWRGKDSGLINFSKMN
ncbi:DUF3732 domain-containing protein [Algoriphagus zhangzhouensis]|uniref:AAA domain-containing protein n=1 Tax=Algoriphagus zhangzhouensis TaxID=1073327 RepID=A0A1M7ZB25_9BACT|nr:DUF3732 domain-containing protein [Algoriphagus zhangzhouensis]TDY47032.1 AAA domain-containing protein [Algoriphagus zhangzhouensis]SHO62009.1 AAA domain-containing protein [Algoriphagus zhangzhouensis]